MKKLGVYRQLVCGLLGLALFFPVLTLVGCGPTNTTPPGETIPVVPPSTRGAGGGGPMTPPPGNTP